FNKGIVAELGARFESTVNKAVFNLSNSLDNDYYHISPNVSFSKSYEAKKQSIRIGYNQRLRRPGVSYLDPFENKTDENNIRMGNPNLKPEQSHQFEIGYSNYAIENLFFTVSPFFRTINNSIQESQSLKENGAA